MLFGSSNQPQTSIINRNSWWRYLVLLCVLSIGILYALPNIFGDDVAIQISAQRGANLGISQLNKITSSLEDANIQSKKAVLKNEKIIIHFSNSENQLKAKTVIEKTLKKGYVIALHLASAAPEWLNNLNANPMYLGLDLRGGVYFLMEVDVEAAVSTTIDRRLGEIRRLLRDETIRYTNIRREENNLIVQLQSAEAIDKTVELLETEFTDNITREVDINGQKALMITFREDAIKDIQRFAVKQNITTLRNRVNELGVAEPVIQQQGANRIVVQLPGVQDTARAKEILGATATLEYRLVDDSKDPRRAASTGFSPPGTELYYFRDGTPILLKKQVIVTGESVINARSGIDQNHGSPMVSVTLDSAGGKRMLAITKRNVNRRMAVVFIETQLVTNTSGDATERKRIVNKSVINAATIVDQFANRFQTTGLDNPQEARDLALLLRAGALAAPLDIVEERTIGPSLGKENIDQGFFSVIIGLLLVLVIMVVRYKIFGVIANIALCLNLVLIVAALSLLQATLTLPGIAGIVLTVGMAVDANVLIFERIREELRAGRSVQLAISAGYDRAFVTIADANITTLIASLVLFGFGTGPIKGFAVTLSFGIITSMFTAIMMSRIIVNFFYGNDVNRKSLAI